MKNIQGSGVYTNSKDGAEVSFTFQYPHYETLQDAVDNCEDEGELLQLINRMSKVDARNTASAKAQASNGHNQRVMTPEQKESNKAKAKTQRAVFSALQGKTADELEAMGLPAEVIEALTA